MKLAYPAILIAALVASPTVYAAECTQAQLASVKDLGSNPDFAKECASVLGSAPIDASKLASLNPCADPKCVAFYKKFAESLPVCEIAGFTLKSSYEKAIAACAGASGSAPTGMPTTMPSDQPTGMPTTMPSGQPTGMPTTMPTAMPTESGSANTTGSSNTTDSTNTAGSSNTTDTTNTTTTTTTSPPSSGASPVKEADTPAPSKTTSSGAKTTPSVVIVASTLLAAGSWVLVA